MSDLTEKMRDAANGAADGYNFGSGLSYVVTDAIIAAALRAIPEGAYLTWPIPMGVTLESWTERTVASVIYQIEASRWS